MTCWGLLPRRAMSNAWSTSSVRRCVAIAEPTTRRLQASSMTARYKKPAQLLPFRRAQAIRALTRVEGCLLHPSPNRLCRRFELPSQLLRGSGLSRGHGIGTAGGGVAEHTVRTLHDRRKGNIPLSIDDTELKPRVDTTEKRAR